MSFLEGLRNTIIGVLTAVTATVSPVAPVVTPVPSISASPVATYSAKPQVSPVNPGSTYSPLPLTGENYYYIRGTYTYLGQAINYFVIVPKRGGSFSGAISGACEAQLGANYEGGEGGKISGTASGKCNILFVKYQGSVSFKGNLYPEQKKMVIEIENAYLPPITLNY